MMPLPLIFDVLPQAHLRLTASSAPPTSNNEALMPQKKVKASTAPRAIGARSIGVGKHSREAKEDRKQSFKQYKGRNAKMRVKR